MFTTGETVGLAEWICNVTTFIFPSFNPKKNGLCWNLQYRFYSFKENLGQTNMEREISFQSITEQSKEKLKFVLQVYLDKSAEGVMIFLLRRRKLN